MIEFTCDKCGQKLQMLDEYAGKKCRCPDCKTILIVPEPVLFEFEASSQAEKTIIPYQSDASNTNRNINSALDLKPKPDTAETNPYPDKQQNQEYFEEYPDEQNVHKEAVNAKKSALVEIFLYPASPACLSIIAVIVGIPFLINFLGILAGPLSFFIMIPGFFIMIVIAAYTFWYFGNCIIDSSEGQKKAPDVLINAPSLGDMGWQFLQLAICICFFLAPPIIYYMFTTRTDITLYILLAYTAFFLPIGLLAVVLHDTITALNPVMLIRSIFVTFFSYIKLVVLFYLVGYLFLYVSGIHLYFPLDVFIEATSVYLLIILAHLLGRFYWTNREILDWDTG